MNLTLQNVHLKYFKKHEDQFVEFAPGLTVIRGDNWAGKSSILQGIYFAFVGVGAVPGGKPKIQTRNRPKAKTEVVLNFLRGDEEITLLRTLSTAQIIIDGEVKAAGHTAVNEYIEKFVFGMDAKRAMELTFSRQSQTAALLTLGAPALNRLVEELNNADYVERLIEAAGKRVKLAEGTLATLGEIEDPEELKNQAREIQLKEVEDYGELQIVDEHLSVKNAEVIAGRRNLATMEAHNKLVKDRPVLEDRLANQRAAVAERTADEPEVDEDRAMVVRAEIQQLEEQIDSEVFKDNQRATHNRMIQTLTQWFETTGAQWEEQQNNVELKVEAEKKLAVLTDSEKELSREVRDFRLKVTTAEQALAQAVCETCGRAFDPEHEIKAEDNLAQYKEGLENWTERYSVVAAKLVTAKKEVQRLKGLCPPDGYETVYSEKVSLLEATQANLSRLPEPAAQGLQALRGELSDAQAELAELSYRTTLRAMWKLALENAQTLVARTEAALAALPEGAEIDTAQIRAEIQLAQEAITEATEIRGEWLAAITAKKAEIKGLVDRAGRAEAAIAKRDVAERQAKRFAGLQRWLRESKAAFLSEIWETILASAGEFVSNATGGYASAVGRSDDGEFSVVEGGEEGPMVGTSGGMQQICGVGLRMGLGHALPQSLGFNVFDEPSSELSDENAAVFAGALRAQGQQVILVTHRNGEEYLADHLVVL